MSTAPPESASPPSEIEPGYLEVFRPFPKRAAILEAAHRALLGGIDQLAGRDCRERVEAAGLDGLHHHFPRESLGDLESLVVDRLKPLWLRWAAQVGRESVGWEEDFFVQDLLLLRVNYPFNAPKLPSLEPAPPGPRLRRKLLRPVEQLRYARYPWKVLGRLPELVAYVRARKSAPEGEYRCHPAHTDSWFGQPVGSLSLWLGIAGVQNDTVMCLYPETSEMRMPQNELMYFGSGFQLPPATRPDLGDGDLLVFSTDMLHCSQLNVSDRTRIAFSIRISPKEPIFDENNFWYVAKSHKASKLLAGEISKPGRFGARAQKICWREDGWPYSAAAIELDREFTGERIAVARSEQLSLGGKLVLVFPQREILLFRSEAGLRAFSGRCPHNGYRLADGPNDAEHLTCPGHGLEFDLGTGASKIPGMKLEAFPVSEESGTIFLG